MKRIWEKPGAIKDCRTYRPVDKRFLPFKLLNLNIYGIHTVDFLKNV